MLLVNAGPAELHHFGAIRFERGEIELLGAVITVMQGGHRTGLQAIGADDRASR